MKIGILIGSLPPETIGGAELQAEKLGRLLGKKHRVLFLIRCDHNLPRKEKRRGYYIKRRRFIGFPCLCIGFDLFSSLGDIYRNRSDIDVLLCYNMDNGLIGALAKGLFHIPTILFIQGEEEYIPGGPWRNRIYGPIALRFSDSVVVQTERMRIDLLEGLHRKRIPFSPTDIMSKIQVVPNGVEIRSRMDLEGEKLLYVGRLTRKKGIEYLISAVKLVGDADLLIVGDGPDRDRLEKMALGLRVEFVGRASPERICQYLKQAKILILPSLYEGLPNVILEAMAVGVPVIATRVGGIPDLVKDGETGLLVEPGSVDELTRGIRKLIEDDDLRKKLANNSFEEAKKYSWDRVVERFDNLMERIVK
jgi:glycosyltransferase involved in cell wall biosynthesis